MECKRVGLLSLVCLFLAIPLNAQQAALPAAPRDARAVGILQKSVAAMALTVPSDSTAEGNLTIVEGSTDEAGSISFQTLGTDYTSEIISLPEGDRTVVYAKGDAKEINGTQTVHPPLQLIVIDQCADFPLPLLSAMLINTDEAFRYVGEETLNGESVEHIQTWRTFATKPKLQELGPFGLRDIWIDSTSGLPLKIAYSRQAGGGAVPAVPITVTFSDYKNVNGVLYPFQIEKTFNGMPWQTISIQSVAFNTGLTESQFQTE